MKRSLEESALTGLTFGRVLMDDPDTNSTFVLASAESATVPVVVILRKTPFQEADVKAIVEVRTMQSSCTAPLRMLLTRPWSFFWQGSDTGLEEVQQNDEYSKYRAQVCSSSIAISPQI